MEFKVFFFIFYKRHREDFFASVQSIVKKTKLLIELQNFF